MTNCIFHGCSSEKETKIRPILHAKIVSSLYENNGMNLSFVEANFSFFFFFGETKLIVDL